LRLDELAEFANAARGLCNRTVKSNGFWGGSDAEVVLAAALTVLTLVGAGDARSY